MFDGLPPFKWMLSARQSREVRLVYFTLETPLCGQFALPLAAHTVAVAVVIVLGVGKLLLVVLLSLARAEGLRDGQHTICSRRLASEVSGNPLWLLRLLPRLRLWWLLVRRRLGCGLI